MKCQVSEHELRRHHSSLAHSMYSHSPILLNTHIHSNPHTHTHLHSHLHPHKHKHKHEYKDNAQKHRKILSKYKTSHLHRFTFTRSGIYSKIIWVWLQNLVENYLINENCITDTKRFYLTLFNDFKRTIVKKNH